MKKILCFISEDFADFEVALALHKIRTVGNREVITVGYTDSKLTSESGLKYIPDMGIEEAMDLDSVEGLIIPGGPIRVQLPSLTKLIEKLNDDGKMIAAICNGPQYLGRAGLLDNKRFTTSCSKERIDKLGVDDPFPRENFLDQRVVTDGNIITAQGRAFVDFSFELFNYLNIYKHKEEQSAQLYRDIMDR